MRNRSFITKYFTVQRSDIAYLRFIIESYEGLATLSTMDSGKGIISLSVPHCFVGEADRLMQALKSEITITEHAFREGCPDMGERHDKQEHDRNA